MPAQALIFMVRISWRGRIDRARENIGGQMEQREQLGRGAIGIIIGAICSCIDRYDLRAILCMHAGNICMYIGGMAADK